MANSVRILVFHRNRLFRECLAKVLSLTCQFDVVTWDHWQVKTAKRWPDESIDVVLIDLNLPDSLAVELTEFSLQLESRPKVLLLVPDGAEENFLECVAAGAHGCVVEHSDIDDVVPAIERVLHGETFCSPDMAISLYRSLSQVTKSSRWKKQLPTAKLTSRESDVLDLLAQRMSNKEIARKLSVSTYTVKNHVHSILEKLKVDSRQEAADRIRGHHWTQSR